MPDGATRVFHLDIPPPIESLHLLRDTKGTTIPIVENPAG